MASFRSNLISLLFVLIPSFTLSLSLLAYLRGITDCLLSLALPPDNASNRLVFGLAQDLLSEQVLLPTAHYISTPFYFNSSVIGLVSKMYF